MAISAIPLGQDAPVVFVAGAIARMEAIAAAVPASAAVRSPARPGSRPHPVLGVGIG